MLPEGCPFKVVRGDEVLGRAAGRHTRSMTPDLFSTAQRAEFNSNRRNGAAQLPKIPAPAIRQGLLPRRDSVSTRVGRHFLASAVELLDRFDEILRIHQRRQRRSA
jgi:hypothetical protein